MKSTRGIPMSQQTAADTQISVTDSLVGLCEDGRAEILARDAYLTEPRGEKLEQASLDVNGQTIYRWQLSTNKGAKIVWAEDSDAARRKGERHGFAVSDVQPIGSLLTNRERGQQ